MESQTTLQRPMRIENMGCLTVYGLIGVGGLLVLLYDGGRIFPDFLNPMFYSPRFMVGGIAVGVMIGLAALRWGSGSRVLRSALAVGIAAMLVFPLLLPVLYAPYAPYAQPADGYEMVWITQPDNAWMSAFKTAQRRHDAHGCTYSLHGWSSDAVLYYGSSCEAGVWRYDPAANSEPQWISALPDGVALSEVDSGVHHPSGGISYPTPPIGFSLATRFDFITYEVARLPEHGLTAVAIMNWYGPRDVVILSQGE